jgi:hypothetical protein
MKINSTTICYALIVLIVGYLLYINRNVIMGTTSKFGAPGDITVYVFNMLVDAPAPLTISSTGAGYKTEYLKLAGKDTTWFRPLTINNSYPLIIKTTYNSPRTGDVPMELKLENSIYYPFMNDDFILVIFDKKTGRYCCDIMRYGKFLRRQYLVKFY